jgi:DNA (cytosine-5)-methyltransferase 1
MHYYNEWNAYKAEWLRNLIRDGLIPEGKVDERGIEEVKAEDLEGFSQCHWFAGIAGWAEAFRLADWFSDIPAWTASCPCQPLSCAGKREGEKDSRHLWPVFFRLICQRRPPVVFGEQTASGDGPEWVAGVRLDLEAAGYRVGVAILPAACVGAPHPRARIWWVAHARGSELARRPLESAWQERQAIARGRRTLDGLADSSGARRPSPGRRPEKHSRSESEPGCSHVGRLADADGIGTQCEAESSQAGKSESRRKGFWSDYQVLYRNEPKRGKVPCRAEPGVFPLVDGFPTRVEQVSAYGDSIVPACAAEFIKAFKESLLP